MLDLNNNHPDDGLLEMARMNAATNWEEMFVADQLRRRQQYGLNFTLTKTQRETLEKIAGDDA